MAVEKQRIFLLLTPGFFIFPSCSACRGAGTGRWRYRSGRFLLIVPLPVSAA